MLEDQYIRIYRDATAYALQTPPEAANDYFCALASLFVSFGNFRGAYAIRSYLGTFLFYGFHSYNMVGAQQHTLYKCRWRWRRCIFVQHRIFLDRIFVGRMQYAPTRIPDSFLFFDFRFSGMVGAYCIRPTNATGDGK